MSWLAATFQPFNVTSRSAIAQADQIVQHRSARFVSADALFNLRAHRQPPANFQMQSAMPLESVDLLNQSFCVTQLLGLALRVNHSVN